MVPGNLPYAEYGPEVRVIVLGIHDSAIGSGARHTAVFENPGSGRDLGPSVQGFPAEHQGHAFPLASQQDHVVFFGFGAGLKSGRGITRFGNDQGGGRGGFEKRARLVGIGLIRWGTFAFREAGPKELVIPLSRRPAGFIKRPSAPNHCKRIKMGSVADNARMLTTVCRWNPPSAPDRTQLSGADWLHTLAPARGENLLSTTFPEMSKAKDADRNGNIDRMMIFILSPVEKLPLQVPILHQARFIQ